MPGFVKSMMGSGCSALQATSISGAITQGATATGTNQATGYPLQTEYTIFTTVAASTAAVLPVASNVGVLPADEIFVANNGANALAVFPPVGGNIGTTGVNTAVSVPANKTAYFINTSGLNYVANVSA